MAKKTTGSQPDPDSSFILDARAVDKHQDRVRHLLAAVEEHNRLPSHINSFEVEVALAQFFRENDPFFYHLPKEEWNQRPDQSIVKAHMNVIEALHHLCDWAKLPWPPKTDNDWNVSSRNLGPIPQLVVACLTEALSLLPGQHTEDSEGKKKTARKWTREVYEDLSAFRATLPKTTPPMTETEKEEEMAEHVNMKYGWDVDQPNMHVQWPRMVEKYGGKRPKK